MEWTEVELVPKGQEGVKKSDDKKVVNVSDLDVNQLKQISSMKKIIEKLREYFDFLKI